jgi:thiol-disulfide isomerase/thioredoxin
MNFFDRFAKGLPLNDFITRYGTPPQQSRWKQSFEAVVLTAAQRELLAAFKRETNVLVLAGAWCGDCSGQCPIFDRFAETAPVIKVRYIDRDEHADVQKELQINGGNRVPVAIFFSEDGQEIARYGERTLSKYRQLVQEFAGAGCPTGLVRAGDPLLAQITQDWLNEFERVQWILRLSPRLRARHGD